MKECKAMTFFLKKHTTLQCIAVCLVVFLCGLVLNHYTPYALDDYSYMYSWKTGERIISISQIPESINAHYFRVNGRVVTHIFAMLFLLMDKGIFNVINSAAFLLQGFLIYYIAIGTYKKFKVIYLVLIYCGIFLLTPAFARDYLWVVGSSNYLYGIILQLIYLVPYRYFLTNKRVDSLKKVCGIKEFPISIVRFAGMMVLGFFACNTVENGCAAVIIATISFLVCFKSFGNIPKWSYGIGGLCGVVCLLISPGQARRLAGTGGVSIVGLFKRVCFITSDLVCNLWVLLFAIGVLLAIVIENRVRIGSKKDWEFVYVATLSFAASVYSMVLSPYFPKRAWCFPVVWGLILCLKLCEMIREGMTINVPKAVQIFSIAFLCVLVGAVFFNGFLNCKNAYIEVSNRESMILKQKNAGYTEIFAPAITYNSRYVIFDCYGDLIWDADKWPNTAFARYYGVERVLRDDSLK